MSLTLGTGLVARSLLAICFVLRKSSAHIVVPPMDDVSYSVKGDFNIGVIVSISDHERIRTCGTSLPRNALMIVEVVEVIVYAVTQINLDNSLLPNLKLGFVILDACKKTQAAVFQAMRFLPQSVPEDYTPSNKSGFLHSFDVIGVIGTDESYTTIPVSHLLGGFGIPLISFWADDDMLSDKDAHPTFLRVIPPDTYHIKALLYFLNMNKWFHYSVLVEDDEQGRSSLKVLRGYAGKYGMCICTIIKVSELADYESTIETLLSCSAKVVVVMISKESAKILVDTIETHGAAGKLLWIGNDNWLEYMYFTKPMEGLIVVSPSSIDLPGFVEYYKKLDITNKNPWFRQAFETLLDCSNNACLRKYLSIVAGKLTLSNADIYDSVMMYARALHTMLYDKCQKFVDLGNTFQVQNCFKANSANFTAYLKSVSFKGASGHISIDSKGNKLSEIYVYQTVKDEEISEVPKEEKFGLYHNMPFKVVKVAKYDIPNDRMYPLKQITYTPFQFNLQELFIEAKCKAPCAANEYKHYIRKCCWICKRCQDNERVSENDTACQKCPYLEWPAMNNLKLSTCKEITAVTFDWTSPVTFSLLIMAAFGIFMVLCILVTLWFTYRPKMLDLGSFSVNIVQLLAIIWGYVAIPMLLLRPSILNCNAGLILFEVSFNVVYLSLLIQSVDVYRNCRRIIEPYELEYTSVPYQVAFIIVLLIIEGLTMAFLHYNFPIIPLEVQPVASIKYAELICEIPTPHIIAFLVFNVGVLLLCSIFALKSQNDPYGLQQSRLVAMFVVLAMIMWIAFMPAYFTSVHKQMQTYFRIMAILFNHSSALVVNFSPFLFSLIYKKCPESRRTSGHSSSISSSHGGLRKKSMYPGHGKSKYDGRKSIVKFDDNQTTSHKLSPQPTDGGREADGEGATTADNMLRIDTPPVKFSSSQL